MKKENKTNSVSSGDVELMIWLYSDNAEPAGSKREVITTHILLNDRIERAEWEIWVNPRHGGGWTYIALVLRNKIPCGEVAIDLYELIDGLSRKLGLDLGEMYMMSIELGSEVFYSPKITVEWDLYKYVILVEEPGTSSIYALREANYVSENID